MSASAAAQHIHRHNQFHSIMRAGCAMLTNHVLVLRTTSTSNAWSQMSRLMSASAAAQHSSHIKPAEAVSLYGAGKMRLAHGPYACIEASTHNACMELETPCNFCRETHQLYGRYSCTYLCNPCNAYFGTPTAHCMHCHDHAAPLEECHYLDKLMLSRS